MKSFTEIMESDAINNIREQIKEIMYEDNETFHSLSKKIGINHQSISKFVKEKGFLNFASLVKIEKYLITRKSK